ncbi:MAG: VOC family protein [Lewinella sp.]
MKIEHLAIWVEDLEEMKAFYLKFFELNPNERYHNPRKNFSSYFLSFPTGARIELMQKPEVSDAGRSNKVSLGIAHFAISVGSKEKVDAFTNKVRESGYQVVGEPRRTGDGYYESVIADPEGNLIEITE